MMKSSIAVSLFLVLFSLPAVNASAAITEITALDGTSTTSVDTDELDGAMTGNLNTVSFEALGRGGYYSVNFDRMVTPVLNLGAGFSYYPIKNAATTASAGASSYVIPAFANIYFSTEKFRPFATMGFDIVIRPGTAWRSSTVSKRGVTPEAQGLFEHSGAMATAGFGYEFRMTDRWMLRAAPYLMAADRVSLTFGLSLGASL